MSMENRGKSRKISKGGIVVEKSIDAQGCSRKDGSVAPVCRPADRTARFSENQIRSKRENPGGNAGRMDSAEYWTGGDTEVSVKEKAPSAATLEATETAALAGTAISDSDFTSGGAGRQGRISSLLLQGEEHAIPGPELARMAGVNSRTLRLLVDKERLQRPICASDSGYFLPDSGNKGACELRKFLRRMDSRATANRKVTRSARAALQALEKGPLPGQQTLFNGGST